MLDLITSHKEDLAAIVGSVVIIASALANIFPKATLLGKIAHFLALNFRVK
jgi:hypothetical protein